MSIRSGRLPAKAFLAALAAGFGADPVAAADLFRVPTAVESSGTAPAPAAPGVVRDRVLAVNAEAVSDGALPDELTIDLFPGLAPRFAASGAEPAFGGGWVWRGKSADGGSATLVVVDGKVTGRVLLKGRAYRIKPAGGRAHRIAELTRRGMPKDGPHRRPNLSRAQLEAEDVAPAAAGDGVVTVLFAYTAAAKKESGDILADVNLSVALTNDAYAASDVQTSLKLVGTIAVKNYDESKVSYDQTLENLTFDDEAGSAAFKATRNRRDAVGADLVVLLRKGGDFCGLAWVVDAPNAGSSGFGYSEVSRDCIEFDTVAHEIGHNRGLLHDRFVEDQAGSNVYNYGYVNVAKRVIDIMAYFDRCDDAGVACDQVNVFSNPRLTIRGKPFGIPKGKSGAADASRRLNETTAGIASYRPDAAADPVRDAAEARAAD